MRPPTKLPEGLGPIHFVGIGGIGMSGIAEVLINLGYKVQGSDLNASDITERLIDAGAKIFQGQSPENIADAEVVVVSSAIKRSNPELAEARRRGLPVVRRAEMLAELMRLKSNIAVAGTHGKTTTTTMVATLLEHGGFDPTVVNGGIIRSFGSNARRGQGEWMVVEADESDGTFVKLPATVAVVTNIDPEHLDYYGDFEKLKDAFDHFVSNVPFYGFVVCCTDHPEVQALVGRLTDRRIVTFGFNPQADVSAENLEYENGRARYDIVWRTDGKRLDGCTLPMPGDHNVSNSLGAAAVARGLGMGGEQIRGALANFAGVKRRFTRVGRRKGVEIIDDYAHHPAEIAAVLKASRQASTGRVLAIHQPHRYTRLSNLFDEYCTCFNEADVVAIADVYPAGEDPIPGADKETLVAGLKRHGHRSVTTIDGENGLGEFIDAEARIGDIVVCMGAGTITSWASSAADESEGS